MDEAREKYQGDDVIVPDDLHERIKKMVDRSSNSWDDALWRIVKQR